MFQSSNFFVLSCLFLTVSSQQSDILPPQNVSLRWTNNFCIEMSWEPPQDSMKNCTYTVIRNGNVKTVNGLTYEFCVVMKRRRHSEPIEIKTVCGDRSSKPFKVNQSHPDLVKGLECYVPAISQTHCSWIPDGHADLQFYYRAWRSDNTVSINAPDPEVQTCSSYIYNGSVTGCKLEADNRDELDILINGTLNNRDVWYSDRIRPSVRPAALKWTVTKKGGKLYINWTPPNINVDWKTTIRYTRCKETKDVEYVGGETSAEWDVASNCAYDMAIKTEPLNGDGRESPWSEEKRFEADTNPWLYAGIIIPLTFAGLAALIFVCCRKNKDIIFPKVPEPRDFLSDISDNNNKITVRNLYVPAEEEEEDCKITLVGDPNSNILDV